MSTPLLVDPPLELSLFQDSEKRPLVVERPGPDVPDATDESSRVENGRSLRSSLRSAHFFLEAMMLKIQSKRCGKQGSHDESRRLFFNQTSATGSIFTSFSTLLSSELF